MLYRIGDFSKKIGLSIRTLRYYDDIGLFKPVEVDLFTSYRYYSDDQIKDLELIDTLKKIGFTLEEIIKNWNNFNEELFLIKKKELLEEIHIKNSAIKKVDELRSKIKNGIISEEKIELNIIKKKSIF